LGLQAVQPSKRYTGEAHDDADGLLPKALLVSRCDLFERLVVLGFSRHGHDHDHARLADDPAARGIAPLSVGGKYCKPIGKTRRDLARDEAPPRRFSDHAPSADPPPEKKLRHLACLLG